jgi:hypothetical protein
MKRFSAQTESVAILQRTKRKPAANSAPPIIFPLRQGSARKNASARRYCTGGYRKKK